MKTNMKHQLIPFLLYMLISFSPFAQKITWNTDGGSYTTLEAGQVVSVNPLSGQKTVLVSKELLKPSNSSESLKLRSYSFSSDKNQVLLYTNTKKVWRLDTKGDYWVLNLATKQLTQLGKKFPASTLMFAKLSPDGSKVAYVQQNNIYVEDIATNTIMPLTTDGTTKLINGTFDWAYEEEFFCRDGFRWSPDGKSIAYWQIDANTIKDFYMINNTDSEYSKIVPVEYPKVGQTPSACRIGVVALATQQTTWLKVPGEINNNYIPKMEWIPNSNDVILEQLSRKQNEAKLFVCQAQTGEAKVIFSETDEAWVEFNNRGGEAIGWDWLNNGKEFLWVSEKDGWNHLYRIGLDGKAKLLTIGNYDVIDVLSYNEAENIVYFTASPDNARQQYLYKTTLDGKGKLERVTPKEQSGTHNYQISPNQKLAFHSYNSTEVSPINEVVSLPAHKAINEQESIVAKLTKNKPSKRKVEFFDIKTADNITLSAWMVKPANFDSTKKYPIVFYVYTEPAGATTKDEFYTGFNNLYLGDMAKDGYIYASIDGRGTPLPKGRAWRKAIYRNIGQINIRDQAMGAKELLKKSYIDTSRVAVWGWSGGGSTTLNLLFQYPEIYKTGIAIAAVGNQLTYDNIYQERYMGLPQENKEDFIKGSPVTHAKNLQGNLLYIHGTGDDNVHYQNAEMLVNELIKYNKQFQFMPYPNRTHSISEGEGTGLHLATLFTNYLRKYCPPGGK